MIKCGTMGLIAALLLTAGEARAEEKEPSALIEMGGATEWDLRGGQSFGPAVAIEVTPLKDWLEIEGGVSPLFGGGHTDWNTDLVFKKPFTLSKTVEVEFGVGPEWLHTTGGGKTADSLGGEAVVEFQFWPWPNRNYGWYLEPSYGYDFGSGHAQSFGLTVGLLIAIP
ncbi:MAG: hypothetical protein ABSA90_04980 [Xanthobacteraceae bacterium]|jgi:hypothetical protein